MTKRKFTKKDPKQELASFLEHRSNNQNQKPTNNKVSASLTKLNGERRRALRRRLGFIIFVSVLSISGLSFFVSPSAQVRKVTVYGANEIEAEKLVNKAGIKPTDQVASYLFGHKEITKKLKRAYPEIKSANVKISQINHLSLIIQEHSVIAYIKTGTSYYKILNTGKLSKQKLSWDEVDHSKPLFIGYNQTVSLQEDLAALRSLPTNLKKQVKMLSGKTKRPSQIVLLMKDGNVIIGNVNTIAEKIKYYPEIKQNLTEKSIIDFEVGAYSRTMTNEEKQTFGIN